MATRKPAPDPTAPATVESQDVTALVIASELPDDHDTFVAILQRIAGHLGMDLVPRTTDEPTHTQVEIRR